MSQERNRLDTKFRESLRGINPKDAVFMHLKDMWTANTAPNMDDLETVGSVCSNIYSDEEDYLVVTEEAYILVGKNASVSYGVFDGFASGNKSRKQIVDGLGRLKDYTIYKIHPQFISSVKDKPIATLMEIESIDIVNRIVYSKGYGFKMSDIDLDRSTMTFIVKQLIFDGKYYHTPSGIMVENIIPRKVEIDESYNSPIVGVPQTDTEDSE